jgi:hypothetical protein
MWFEDGGLQLFWQGTGTKESWFLTAPNSSGKWTARATIFPQNGSPYSSKATRVESGMAILGL